MQILECELLAEYLQSRVVASRKRKHMTQQQLDYERLVDELMKEKPDKRKVMELSNRLKIPYSLNIATQIDSVMKSASSIFRPRRPKKELES